MKELIKRQTFIHGREPPGLILTGFIYNKNSYTLIPDKVVYVKNKIVGQILKIINKNKTNVRNTFKYT